MFSTVKRHRPIFPQIPESYFPQRLVKFLESNVIEQGTSVCH
jgi:hypothetical protein